jgi:hypothetical protein
MAEFGVQGKAMQVTSEEESSHAGGSRSQLVPFQAPGNWPSNFHLGPAFGSCLHSCSGESRASLGRAR